LDIAGGLAAPVFGIAILAAGRRSVMSETSNQIILAGDNNVEPTEDLAAAHSNGQVVFKPPLATTQGQVVRELVEAT
jgi:hypothetical protein